MRIIETHRYKDDPARFFGFEKWASQARDFPFYPGMIDYQALGRVDAGAVHLELEDPNRFFVSDPLFNHFWAEDAFAKVYTICPYTAAWLNRQYGNQKRTATCFPFDAANIPEPQEKLYDVIYAGNLGGTARSRWLAPTLEAIRGFNYRFVSTSPHPYVTNPDVSYRQKLALTAQSRITIVHNLLFADDQQVSVARGWPGMKDNEAMSRIYGASDNGIYLAPQLKSRLFEAAFCKSLILCQRDEWNLVKRFFEPDEYLLYDGDTSSAIQFALAHPQWIEQVTEKAFAHAMRDYTSEVFFERYLREL